MGAGAMTRSQVARIAGASAAAVSAFLFALLAGAISAGATNSADAAIRTGINALSSDILTWLAFALSFVGSTPIWLSITIVAAVVFWRLELRRAAVDLTIVMAGAVVLGNLLKLVFARVRPEVFYGVAPPTYSFPSGHALYAACLYGALACLIADRVAGQVYGAALWVSGILLAGAIGLSRIYLGVHYPSDIAGGFLVAIFWVGLVTAVRASGER